MIGKPNLLIFHKKMLNYLLWQGFVVSETVPVKVERTLINISELLNKTNV
jgi:hypothetical protein